MSELDDSRAATLAKMAESRAEISRLLERPPEARSEDAPPGADPDAFPRSRTLQLLLSGRGVGTVGALVGGLLVARPALALRLLRLLPTGAVARMLLVRGIAALRERRRPDRD